MSRFAKDSLTYTLLFSLGYFVACNSSNNSLMGGGSSGTTTAVAPRMLNSTVRRTAIFPANTGNQPVLASLFDLHVQPDATINNPSALAQSFESFCSAWGPNFGTSIHATFGNTGFVSFNFGNAGVGAGNACEEPPIASVGADENGNPTGFPIFLQGTINNLVVYGIFVSGNKFRCLDTTDTSSLNDSTYVRAYYDLANDTIVLGSGTNQLSVSCSVSIPAGDDVQTIQVQWVKS
jgi:hypothetical protein